MDNLNNKKVSIIIPTGGGRSNDLCDAIQSALDQEYKNIEVLVVSDGKNDSSDTIKRFKDSRLIFIIAEKWGDPVRIREIGIERCSGELICFLDDDDILYPNHIKTLIQYSDAEIIPFSRAKYIFKQNGKPYRETLNIEPNNPIAPYYKPEHIFKQNIAPISSFLINKKMHYEIGGFDKNLIRLEDWDYWARMSLKFKLKFIDVVTNEIRIHLDKESRTIRMDVFKDTNRLLGEKVKERLDFMKKNNKILIDDETRSKIPIPKVSVIMPIYNAQKFLKEAIDSILSQTFTDFELLLINDGSTDQSKEIIEQYKKDPRVKIFHKKNEGITKTLNFGLSKSIGRYVARMDADDISMPKRLELQVKFLDEHRKVGLLGTRFKAITEDKKFIENLDVELTNKELQEKLIKSCRFGHPTVMIRRVALESVGVYDESGWANTVEDYDLWLRIAEKFEIANLSQYLLHYRINPNSITQTKRKINEDGTKECIRRAKERRGLNSNTFVSICIPAYKQPDLLKKALDSIFIQTHKNYEVIVTDDSPDLLVENVCKDFIKNDLNLRYFKNIKRKGTPENWNESIRHAKGEYIKILHHDDWFTDKYALAKFVKMLDKNPEANFAFSGCLNFDSKGDLRFAHKVKNFQIRRLKKDPKFLFAGNFVGAPSTTIFRNGLNIYFDSQFKWVVDIDFYIRILSITGIFEYTKETLISICMMSKDQVTASCVNNKNIQISEYYSLYRKINVGNKVMRPYIFGYFWYLFERFNVKSHNDISKCINKDKILMEFDLIISFQNNKILNFPLLFWSKINGFVSFVLKISLIGFAFCTSWLINFVKNKKNNI